VRTHAKLDARIMAAALARPGALEAERVSRRRWLEGWLRERDGAGCERGAVS
jgi:hypothetical protein